MKSIKEPGDAEEKHYEDDADEHPYGIPSGFPHCRVRGSDAAGIWRDILPFPYLFFAFDPYIPDG